MRSRTNIAFALVAISLLAPKFQTAIFCAPENLDQGAPATKTDTDSKSASEPSGIRVVLPKGKKLILTDGTFQIVREYSVQDDRVRYWSVERSDWEEIPSKLVDWDATHKAEAEQVSSDAKLKAKIHASEVAERTKDIDVDLSLEIKPGLFLPDSVGFYALEIKQIYEMKQSSATLHLSKKREAERIISGMPIISEKETMEIADAHAALRLETSEPEFFIRPADERSPQFRLLRAQIKDGHRVIDNITIHFGGEQTHKANEIEFQTWTPARGVFRYTVGQRLEPGEYAFVEMTKEGINGYVWDFGIDAPRTK